MESIKENKLIFAPQLAKYLLCHGFRIIDLRPDKVDRKKTVFVFKIEDKFFETMEAFSTN